MSRFNLVLFVCIGLSTALPQALAATDFPAGALRALDTKAQRALSTYSQLRTQAIAILTDGRAIPTTRDGMLVQAQLVASTAHPWYLAEETASNDWTQPLPGVAVGLNHTNTFYQGRNAARAVVLAMKVEVAPLATALNQLYDAVSGTLAMCNSSGNALDLKAAGLLEQQARLAYAGQSDSPGFQKLEDELDGVSGQQQGAPGREYRCPR